MRKSKIKWLSQDMEERKNNHHHVGSRILFSRVTGGEELEDQRRQENGRVEADDQKGKCFRCHLGSGKRVVLNRVR